MSIHSRVTQWGNVSRFCVERLGDYSELLSIEASRMRTRLMREVIALVALAVAGLFTLSFVCIAIIATFWATPYFIHVVWAVAGSWLLLSICALVMFRLQRPVWSLDSLQEEIRSDLNTVKEALK
ncbi:phage holin family protein [Paraburkholderia sp. SARCC-3016]|jgi:fatty acid desaturase|uniref:phage holin family protein n=1 Tax=Paraburkholderia sp. SARCC-3016 TaxID=3058611 RepID=UPI0028084A25|nr:phage holin family protein [Paraburkholderia sp. SARCC-3016]MDQ7977278.1 phage holin family protein [Paraburkholderia sp. SARCC-3016]